MGNIWIESALQHHRAGRLLDAQQFYRRALSDAPTNLGVALLHKGDPKHAAAACAKAVQLNRTSASAHTNLGTALAKLDQLSAAEMEHREALRLRPDFSDAWVNLGNVLRELGR